MKKNIAKRLLVAAMLTTLVANPAAVLVAEAHIDISGTGQSQTITGASNITYDGLNGGVVSVTEDASVTMSGTYQNNSSAGQGGVLSLYHASGEIQDGTIFSGNYSLNAGAISSSFSTLTIGDNVEFNGNYSNAYAGAILNQSSDLTIGDYVSFVGNASNKNGGSDSGGALAIESNSPTVQSTVLIGDNATFEGNSTGRSGGAIYVFESSGTINLNIGDNARFVDNKATGSDRNGGAIAVYGGSGGTGSTKGVVIGNNAEFSGNTANGSGGAVYVSNWNNNDTVFEIGGGATFTNNEATNGNGGAIYTTADILLNADSNDISFTGNTASGLANDIYAATDSSVTVKGANDVLIGSGITTASGVSLSVQDSSDLVVGESAIADIQGSLTTDADASVINNGELKIGGNATGNVENNGNVVVQNGGSLIGKVVQNSIDSEITVENGGVFGTSETLSAGTLTIIDGGKINGEVEVTEAVQVNVGSSVFDSIGLIVGDDPANGHITGKMNLKDTVINVVDALTMDLTLSGNSSISSSLVGNVVKIGDGVATNTVTLSNGYNSSSDILFDVVSPAVLKLSPNTGNSISLNSNVTGNGTVLVDEIVTQIDNPNFDSSIPADPATNPEKIDKHWGVGTVNIASDNSGFAGTFVQKMGNVILKAGSKFFGGTNIIENGTLTAQAGATLSGTSNTVQGGTLNLQDGAILAGAVTATTNTTNNTYGTVNLYNGIKGSIDDPENPNAVIIEADSIANGNNGLLTYVNNNDSTEQTINLNDGVGLGLFNGTTVQGDIALQSDKGVRDLALGNGSGLLSADAEDTLAISLGDSTSLSYFDGAVIQDNSTVEMAANSSLNFNNNTDTVDYNPVITSSATTSSINKNGSSAVTINSSLAGFKGSVNTTGGSLTLANTEAVNLNNINANNSVLTVAGDVNANNANFKGANTVINLKGSSHFAGNVAMTDATLNTNNSIVIDNNLTIASTAGNTPSINLMGGGVNTITANNINLNSDTNITFDADPRTSAMDQIIANNIISNGDSSSDPYKLIISGISFTRSPIDSNVSLDISNLLSDSTGSQSSMVALKDGGVVANSAMGRYLITSTASSNALNAALLQLNPQMYRGQVATIATWQNQLVVNNMLFDHMQVVTRQLMDEERTANKYVAAYPQFAPYQYSVKDGSLWYKAYGVFETLSMTKGLHVGNNAYGSLIGADFPLVNLKNGWKLVPTAYVGYNGGHQHYDGVSMYQNGAQLGMMGTAYKGDFITSLLAYGGGYGNDMTVRGQYGNGSDNTGNWFAGVASKTAYNFHLTKDLIFQPTALVSYNAFGAQNWGSNFGAMSMSTGMLNGINAAPGFNLIWQKKSFSLYATAQMVYNVMGSVDGRAGNIDTGNVRMKHAYFEYGVGAMKQLKDRFSGYLQITIRNGGRTGIGFQGGLNWKVGK